LSNGNYIIESPSWDDNRGAATWCNAGTVSSGTVSVANSLVGTDPGDGVGLWVTALTNGNYVVGSPYWNSGHGAATWGDGNTGVTGIVSDGNSLVGSNPNDGVGSYAAPLPNGDYLVDSYAWNGQRGAVTWVSGGRSFSGTISAANSLVGSNPGDQVGIYGFITILSNGNYVVRSPFWSGNCGAVTWGSGSTGVSGIVSDANSLVGSNPGAGRSSAPRCPWSSIFCMPRSCCGDGVWALTRDASISPAASPSTISNAADKLLCTIFPPIPWRLPASSCASSRSPRCLRCGRSPHCSCPRSSAPAPVTC
jgi:hypothetical protein